jgi:hypothetical protein
MAKYGVISLAYSLLSKASSPSALLEMDLSEVEVGRDLVMQGVNGADTNSTTERPGQGGTSTHPPRCQSCSVRRVCGGWFNSDDGSHLSQEEQRSRSVAIWR